MNRYKILGIAIKNAIKESGISRDDVAAHLERSTSLLRYWEDGTRRIQVEELEKLANFVNKPISYFFDYDEADLDKDYDGLFDLVKRTMNEMEELNFPVKLYYDKTGNKIATNITRLLTRLIVNSSKFNINVKFDNRRGGFENEKQLTDYLFRKFRED